MEQLELFDEIAIRINKEMIEFTLKKNIRNLQFRILPSSCCNAGIRVNHIDASHCIKCGSTAITLPQYMPTWT